MATDPVCGMTVDESTGIKEEFEGETFYFCCEECRDQFVLESNSEQFEESI